MKNSLIILSLCCLFLAGCENNTTLKGKTYENYGLFTKEKKNPDVVYELSATNIVAAVILSETVAVPIYIVGWELWHPIALKDEYVPGEVQSQDTQPNAPMDYTDPKYNRYK